MYKIGVIGSKQCVAGFVAVGLSVFPCDDVDKARATLHRLAESGEYAILYVVESYCKDMSRDLERYRDVQLPVVVPIPGMDGSFEVGVGCARSAVERAVGVDIIYGNQE